MSLNYILNDEGKPIREPDILKWAHWFEKAERRVGLDIIGESKVSTVFLGVDHGWGQSSPVLWETMVFGGKLDQEQDRCSGNREQAEAMHEKMVDRVGRAIFALDDEL